MEVGVVNAAQFVPYAVLGFLAGAYTDRWRRKPVLVWASVGRAFCLSAIPILWLVGELQIWMLVLALLSFGAFSVFGFAATQPLLPRLVPRDRLVVASARLDQADAAAQTVGPAISGGLVGLLGPLNQDTFAQSKQIHPRNEVSGGHPAGLDTNQPPFALTGDCGVQHLLAASRSSRLIPH